MEFKQMFDAEAVPMVLNEFYESGITNDLFALANEANSNVTFAVKTPSGIIETRNIRNKIMQGDILSPLVSRNMVDRNISKMAIITKNTYIYKNKVEIPPLLMQDDTLDISKCGYQTAKMDNFLNNQTNIMGLQFGKHKFIEMHIGKSHNKDMCVE